MRYFLPIPTASAYRQYYCLSCLLSLWLKNVDCSLTERWSRVYSPFNRLFQEKYDCLGTNCTSWQSPRKNQPVSVLYNLARYIGTRPDGNHIYYMSNRKDGGRLYHIIDKVINGVSYPYLDLGLGQQFEVLEMDHTHPGNTSLSPDDPYQGIIPVPVRDKDLLRKVPIAYSFQCAQAVPLAYSRRNSMQLMPHRDS